KPVWGNLMAPPFIPTPWVPFSPAPQWGFLNFFGLGAVFFFISPSSSVFVSRPFFFFPGPFLLGFGGFYFFFIFFVGGGGFIWSLTGF
ncbi:hypothetical protein, partial [Mesorhizobium sp. WSM4887]|uniref:hypothetical protein n=1 Tax=Mesorhizobium sp. WSM4887 TaxID=3038543 RepID=UPI002415D4C7